MSDDAGDDKRGWAAVIDPRLVARCVGHQRAGELRRTPSLPTWMRPVPVLLYPKAWNIGYLRVREREIPGELLSDLTERMPQALLRDLHRVVREPHWVAREIIPGTGDREGNALLAQVRAARRPPERPTVEPSTRVMRALQIWRRHLVTERWEPALRDDEPRRGVAT